MSFVSKFLEKIFSVKVQIFWIIAIVLSIYFLYFSFEHSSQPSHGFATYYTASNLFLDGESVVDFYDDDWFSLKVEKYVPGIYEVYLINLPTTALVFLPVANFNYTQAKIIWTIFDILLLAIVIGLIINRLKLEGVWLPLALIIIFSFQPLYANVAFGQVYIFIFFLLVLTWFAYESGSEKPVGIIIGLVLILKTIGIFLLILLALGKKWKSLLWTILALIFLFTATLPLFGLNSWFAYFNKVLDYSSNPTLSVTAYQSVHSFFHHFFVFDAQWNPVPFFNLPLLGKSMTILFTLIILIVTIVFAFKSKKSELSFGSFIIVGIILSPPSIDYHYILMLIPIFILLDWLIKNPSVYWRSLFVISYLLIAASLPYISSKITEGWWAVFAYPKLYGALGLWIITLRASYNSKISNI